MNMCWWKECWWKAQLASQRGRTPVGALFVTWLYSARHKEFLSSCWVWRCYFTNNNLVIRNWIIIQLKKSYASLLTMYCCISGTSAFLPQIVPWLVFCLSINLSTKILQSCEVGAPAHLYCLFVDIVSKNYFFNLI